MASHEAWPSVHFGLGAGESTGEERARGQSGRLRNRSRRDRHLARVRSTRRRMADDGRDAAGSALVMLAKWPGGGASKTRLARGLVADGHAPDEAQRWAAAFVRAAVSDLLVRFGQAAPSHGWQCVLLYAPPVDEARTYFASLLEELGLAQVWRMLPVLASSNAKSADLGGILADAACRAREACSSGRVAFFGADCPELPVASVVANGSPSSCKTLRLVSS